MFRPPGYPSIPGGPRDNAVSQVLLLTIIMNIIIIGSKGGFPVKDTLSDITTNIQQSPDFTPGPPGYSVLVDFPTSMLGPNIEKEAVCSLMLWFAALKTLRQAPLPDTLTSLVWGQPRHQLCGVFFLKLSRRLYCTFRVEDQWANTQTSDALHPVDMP